MADLYITIKLLSGADPKATPAEYVEFANLLLERSAKDPAFVQLLGRNGGRDLSVQVRGFDPMVLSGQAYPGHRHEPILPGQVAEEVRKTLDLL